MSVTLRAIRDEEFEEWLPRTRDGYARDMAEHGGFDPDKAAAMSAEQMEGLFPGEKPSADQLVYIVEDDGERVGELWVCDRETPLQRALFIYFVGIDDGHRGKGYGKAAMLLAEEEARRLGLDRIALNVFGSNDVARNLYLSLGYEENAVSMTKHL